MFAGVQSPDGMGSWYYLGTRFWCILEMQFRWFCISDYDRLWVDEFLRWGLCCLCMGII